jgi:hypothetical protein
MSTRLLLASTLLLAASGTTARAETPLKVDCERLLTTAEVDTACGSRGAELRATPWESGKGTYTCSRTLKVPGKNGSTTFTFKVSRYGSVEQVRKAEDPGTYGGKVENYQKLAIADGGWSFQRGDKLTGEKITVGAALGGTYVGFGTSYQGGSRPACSVAGLQRLVEKVAQRLK